jgi:hypothetical protein
MGRQAAEKAALEQIEWGGRRHHDTYGELFDLRKLHVPAQWITER